MTKKTIDGDHQMIKVDPRIVTLINNGVEARHRSMFVVIGDKSCYRVKEMHYLLGKAMLKSKPNILWCYKNNLEISSNTKKRRKQVKSKLQKGLLDQDTADSFALFLETTGITYCFYRESERVLGNTFDMCVLQDFDALTPNLLARTIETVVGGGVIVILLQTLSSLTSFYTMVMNVQKRYRTESHNYTSGRFNERFILSLASCKACIVMDDEVHILPISSHMKTITSLTASKDAEGLSDSERELKDLREQVHDDFPVGPLISKCCTMDQGRALLTFLDAILEKSLGSTIALLAARGRGKSATLGLAIAGAVASGYSNIFVTAPGPENLKTLFEFVCAGLNLLNYKKTLDYDVVESYNPKFKKATVVQIKMKRHHRQTIQYIQPHEYQKLSQAELLVIDEAATIPLPTVKSLLGPYLIFLSSTVNGYEGTGRSLSLKLLKQLEEQNHTLSTSTEIGRHFKKVTLSESVRYASGDPIESWLNSLLCLDVSDTVPIIGRLPPPSECELYYVNRDTLFSYHKDSELFLQRMMALYVASHYKNSPNDLQLIADAPAHHLFVLLGPVDESSNILPDILCVIQICFEGQISHKSVLKSLGSGEVPSGDQLPWKFCEQFRDTSFPSLSGARIVRIATHPSAMRLGYGSAAVELLARYFEGQLSVASELDSIKDPEEEAPLNIVEAAEKASLQEETIKPRNDLPPLLVPLRDRRPEKLHYLGVSFGLTLDLFRFWRKCNFAPFFIGTAPNPITGEYSCMVLRALNNDDIETDGSDQLGFLSSFYKVFKKNFTKYLNRSFRQMEYKLAMSILDPKVNFSEVNNSSSYSGPSLASVSEMLTTTDQLKLEDYTNDCVKHHAIEGFIDDLAYAYFWEKIPVSLSYLEASVLLCFGLQAKDISKIQEEIGLEEHRVKGFLKSVMKKFKNYFVSQESHRPNDIVMEPHPISVDEDLNEGAKQVQEKDCSDMQASIMDEPEKALPGVSSRVVPGMVVSIKSDRSVPQKYVKKQSTTKSKRVQRDNGSNLSKKRKSRTDR